jgi:membrane associated rhomboid family serine protease
MRIIYANDFLRSEFISRSISSICVSLLALVTLIFLSLVATVPIKFQIAIPITLFAIVAPYIAALNIRRIKGVTLNIYDSGFSLPGFLFPKLRKTIPFISIYSKKVLSIRNRKILRIDYVGGTNYFYENQFERHSDFEYLCKNLTENSSLNTKFPLPIVSWILIIAISCFSSYLLFSNSSTPNLDVIVAGAWEKSLIYSGEIDRLVSYGFIHQNLIHLFTNMFSILLLGLALEHRIGRANFLLTFLAGIIISSFGANISSYFIVIGASGGVYALLGAYAVDRYLNSDPNFERYKSTTTKTLLLAVVVESTISLFFVNIALSVHLVGFAFGSIYAFLITRKSSKRITQGILGALTLILSIMFVLKQPSTNEQYKYELSLKWLIENDNPIKTQVGAWGIATSPISTQDSFLTAIEALEKDVANTYSTDTLATLYARSNQISKAIGLDNKIIGTNEIIGSQLARFERAYTKTNPIDISKFAESETIAIDAICDNKRFVRVHTNETDKIPNVCNNQEIIYIREAEAGSKSIRYDLDPKFMALPL